MLRPAITLFLILSLITGVLYPAFITGIGHLFFKEQASGSMITRNQTVIGSSLIGQHFTEPKYFWGRPSATASKPYNALASGGSNLGPLNPVLIENINTQMAALKQAGYDHQPIPIDLVTASASGLDPHISPAGAFYQAPRVALARNISLETVHKLIDEHSEGRQFFMFGEPRVNVLQLNLALEQLP